MDIRSVSIRDILQELAFAVTNKDVVSGGRNSMMRGERDIDNEIVVSDATIDHLLRMLRPAQQVI
jgi:hypothetical protein